ncbi:MAG: ATP-binding protein [Planctomycetota bacterium]|jgi:CO dehydrogenase maturation factor
MKPLIAVSGKGGTGKTTVSALLVKHILASGTKPVLAVDADPNYCLGGLLGIEVPGTLSESRDVSRSTEGPSGLSKLADLELRLNEIVAEGKGFDLITMGAPEGPGCYCYVNALLRDWLEKARRNYAVTVVDNQAGMEHISRLVTTTIDTLVLVAEPTVPSARAVRKIIELSAGLPMSVRKRVIVWNKVSSAAPGEALSSAAGADLVDAVVTIPYDDALAAAHVEGREVTMETGASAGIAELASICGFARLQGATAKGQGS